MGAGIRMVVLAGLGLCTALSGAQAQVADPVVARRGTAVVTLKEVDARVGQLPADVRAGFMNSPERIDQMLQGLLIDEQLANEALEKGLDKEPLFAEEVELAKAQILSRRRQQQFERDLEIPDFEPLARERYMADPMKYGKPERLDLQHVLIRTIGRSEADAIALAEEIQAKAVAGEVPFEKLVAEYTDERNPQTNNRTDGVLREVRRGAMVPTFEEAAFALTEPGEISPVVKTPYGWHVIKLLERKPEVRVPFEKVRGTIIGELRKDFIERSKKYHVEKLRSMPIEAEPDVVMSLRTRYLPEGVDPATVLDPDAVKPVGETNKRGAGAEGHGD